MSGDPGSLANLRDMALPPEIPFWPPAPGIWILACALAAIAAIAIGRAVQRYRAAAYRRAAMAELGALGDEVDHDGADIVSRVSDILKRVAMVGYGRERVAALSGEAWADFIASRAKPGFDAGPIRNALNVVYAGGGPPGPSELRELIGQAGVWIRDNRPLPDEGG
jgi:hypothetical protein